jgi:hypothetical protein
MAGRVEYAVGGLFRAGPTGDRSPNHRKLLSEADTRRHRPIDTKPGEQVSNAETSARQLVSILIAHQCL